MKFIHEINLSIKTLNIMIKIIPVIIVIMVCIKNSHLINKMCNNENIRNNNN